MDIWISGYLDIWIPGKNLFAEQPGHSWQGPFFQKIMSLKFWGPIFADSEIVMVDGTFWDDSFEQDRSWDDFGTTISGI